MEPDVDQQDSKPVHLILSAQSSGHPPATSRLATLSREQTRDELTAALNAGARETFEMMVGTSLTVGDFSGLPRVADYTAMIGLAGDLCGVLSFRCTAESARRIAGLMLNSEGPVPEESVQDAMGEICNIVAGAFKARVTGLADQCMLSVPTVVTGKDYRLHSLANGQRLQAALGFETAVLWITLDLQG